MAASPQLEARSLSAINYLAANPPQYPYSPDLKESLTLYISRVPGTQGALRPRRWGGGNCSADHCPDIILSTVRPQKKNVTGEDITNSLYYIHLDSPQDELLGAPQRLESASSPRSSSESARVPIPRKPLPGSAKLQVPEPAPGIGAAPASPTASLGPAFQPHAFGHPGYGSPSDIPRTPSTECTVQGYRENPMFRKRRSGPPPDASAFPQGGPTSPSAPPIQRKPLGPRLPNALLGAGHDPQAPADPRTEGRPASPTRPGPEAAYDVGQSANISSPPSHLHPGKTLSPGRVGRRPSSVSFSLTVIRRDPASGTQCNVGKVSSFQTNVPTPDNAGPNLDPDNMGGLHTQTIDIRLETSGYAKYRGMPSRGSVDAYRPTSEHSFTQQAPHGAAAGNRGDRITAVKPTPRSTEEGFLRQVVMAYAPSWKSNFKRAFQRRDGPSSPGRTSPDELAPSRPFHTRQASASTIGSVDSADGKALPPLITQPGPGLKPKGYFFLSPWDGRCEFRTSTNGRTLKCRHILDSTNVRIDPREVAQSIRDAQAMGRSRGEELSSALVGAKSVSELRFNLPSTARQEGAGQRNSNQLSGQFSKLLHHRLRSSDDESDDEDDYDEYDNGTPMDLSLGKENAGGGNRGKRVKLGKLIIHDEGLKMLDLVVAANIGVWWTTWGRTV